MASVMPTSDGATLSLRYAGPSSSAALTTGRPAVPTASSTMAKKPPTASVSASSAVATAADEEKRALRQVRSLFLTCRNIVSMTHIQHLDEMTGLRSLSLHMNLVRRVEGLDNLRQLVELDLSGNEIRTLEPSCFRAQTRLERLNLSSNYLSTLPDGVFAFLPALSWLSLAYNGLSDVKSGLASIPRVAPLAYVDLCGNNIAHLDDVLEGLAPHREHVRELRLQTPQQLLSGMSMNMSNDAAHSTAARHLQQQPQPTAANALCVFSPLSPPAVKENPLCLETFPHADGSGGRMTYAERALLFFPKLMVLNGATFGVDPVQAVMQHEQARRQRLVLEREEAEKEEQKLLQELEQQKTEVRLLKELQEQRSKPRSARKLTFAGDSNSRSPPAAVAEDTSRSMHFVTPDRDEDDGNDEQVSEHKKQRERRRSKSGEKSKTPSALHASLTSARSPQLASAGLSPTAQLSPEGAAAGASRISRVQQCRETEVARTPISPASLLASSAGYKLQWRPKRISRGTNTDEDGSAASARDHEESKKGHQEEKEEERQRQCALQAQLEQQLQRAHEQLQLRAAMEADLRRYLDDQVQRGRQLEEQRAQQQRQFDERVSALKDELLRRATEVTIMKKKERASLDAQATASDAHWRGVLDEHKAQWQQTIDSKEEVLAAMQGKLSEAETRQAALAKELQEWKREYQEMRNRCEEAVAELDAATQRQGKERKAQSARFHSLFRLSEAEADARRLLETEAHQTTYNAALSMWSLSEEEKASRTEEWMQYKEMWEKYAKTLQQHYKGVLQHAQAEAESLQTQVATLKALRGSEELAKPSPPTTAPTVTAATGEGTVAPAAATSAADAACDPIFSTTAETASTEAKATQTVVPSFPPPDGNSGSELPPSLVQQTNDSDDPLSLVTAYWKELAVRQKDQLAQLEKALQLSETTNIAMARENKRLLSQIELLQSEEKANREEEWKAEKENLVRALHNLQQDLGKKDAALDALEEEARQKIEEKRHAIAALQEKLERAEELRQRATEGSVQCRDDLEETRKELEVAQQAEQRWRVQCESQEKQLDALTRELNTLKQQQEHRGAVPGAERRQYEVEQARLVSALTIAREQLVRLHQAHCDAASERSRLSVSLEARERELAEVKRRLQEVEESSKQKQRATLEVLTRMMAISE